MTCVENNISAAEAEIYDRQIRLWGVESQKRLRNAKILVIGCKGLGAEVCKDVVLAGVKSLTVMDHHNVEEDDICAQFFSPRDQLGKNRAEASLPRIQQLNPMVEVKADKESIEDKSDEFYSQFTVVCAFECSLENLLKLDVICRNQGIKFFCGDVFGTFGYFFVDLGEHEYVVEDEVTTPVAPKDAGKKPIEKITKREEKKDTFLPLQDALNVDWKSDPKYKKKIPKCDPSYFLVKILHKFHQEKKRKPCAKTHDEDLECLKKIRKEYLEEIEAPEDKVSDFLLESLYAQLVFSCAIVGGVLSQEIIKAVSQKGRPHQNMFFFNPEKCVGFAENYGSSE